MTADTGPGITSTSLHFERVLDWLASMHPSDSDVGSGAFACGILSDIEVNVAGARARMQSTGKSLSATQKGKRRRQKDSVGDARSTTESEQRCTPEPEAIVIHEDNDLEATPRATQQLPSRYPPSTPSSIASSQHGGSVSSSDLAAPGSLRKRQTSPKKKRTMASREWMADAIQTRQIDLGDLRSMPPELQEMVLQIDLYSRGMGIIPERVKQSLAPHLAHFPVAFLDLMVDHEREKYGTVPALHDLVDIFEEAQKMFVEGSSEAAWNVDVHGPLLKLILRSSKHALKLSREVVTTATIEPSDLLPSASRDEKVQSKIVDFSITLKTSERHRQGLNRLAQMGTAIESLNQSLYDPLRRRPIAISIETKRSAEDWDNAQQQLSTWAFAQYAKLQSLLLQARPEVRRQSWRMPPLPLLIGQGHDWYFLALTMEYQEDWGRWQSNLWSKVAIGTTQSYDGIYKIIAVIHYLMDWADTKYRPWLDSNILDPLNRQAGMQ